MKRVQLSRIVYGLIACATLRALRVAVRLRAGSLTLVRALAYSFRARSLWASSNAASPPAKSSSRALLDLARRKSAFTIHGMTIVIPAGRRVNPGHHNVSESVPLIEAP
jgi:hypothetical protein